MWILATSLSLTLPEFKDSSETFGSLGTFPNWKIGPLQDWPNNEISGWHSWNSSVLVKLRPFWVGDFEILPDWRFFEARLNWLNLAPYQIGQQFETLPGLCFRDIFGWANWALSGLAKQGPFGIGEIRSPSNLAKSRFFWIETKPRPNRIGEIRILPDWRFWDPSGLVK